jgi:hypothetical protein
MLQKPTGRGVPEGERLAVLGHGIADGRDGGAR